MIPVTAVESRLDKMWCKGLWESGQGWLARAGYCTLMDSRRLPLIVTWNGGICSSGGRSRCAIQYSRVIDVCLYWTVLLYSCCVCCIGQYKQIIINVFQNLVSIEDGSEESLLGSSKPVCPYLSSS